MDCVHDFRARLSNTESLLFLVVPSFAVHILSAEVLSSIIYKRPGIRPVQCLSPKILCNASWQPSISDALGNFNLTALNRFYRLVLLEAHTAPNSELIEGDQSVEPIKSIKPSDFRTMVCQPSTTREDIFELFKKRFPKSLAALPSMLLIYRTELRYSFQHVSFGESLRTLYEDFAIDVQKYASEENFVTSVGNVNTNNADCVHAFEQIGHIAHVNLPCIWSQSDSEAVNRFKFIFGSLILDHHPQISIVVNKRRKIDSEFREMALEVLAARSPIGSTPQVSDFCFSAKFSDINIDLLVLPQVFHQHPNEKNFTITGSTSTDSVSSFARGESYIKDCFQPDSPIYSVSKIKHNGCRFSFSFLSCFFNKRLEEEHRRMKNMLAHPSSSSDVVFDVFAGVGPISIPIAAARQAKLGSKKTELPLMTGMVHANDLNPECYRFMCDNIVLNGLHQSKSSPSKKILDENIYVHSTEKQFVCAWNMDGLDFIQQALKLWACREKVTESKRNPFCHFIMNLPGTAVENFLSPFSEYFSVCHGKDRDPKSLENAEEALGDGIIIHAYTFVEKLENANMIDAVSKVYDALQIKNKFHALSMESFRKNYLPSPPETIRFVSPSRKMVRITFALSPETASAFRINRNL